MTNERPLVKMRLQCRNQAARDIYVNDIVHRTLDFLETVFAQYGAALQIRPIDPRQLAEEYQYTLFGMISEYILLRLDGKSTEGMEAKMNRHVDFFVQMIR